LTSEATIEAVRELYVTLILLARDESKRQFTLDLGPLPAAELEERDNSQVQAAAEIFMHDQLKIPYYFGIERIAAMATNNIEELLSLAAAIYEGLQAKYVLRRPELVLAPNEQERLLLEAARRKRNFIPKSHSEGTRAQSLLDSIGSFCYEKTFLPNAPYSPGVTGVRLSQSEIRRLMSDKNSNLDHAVELRRVLSECVAENLLLLRQSAASSSRESGTVFYLNRTLCAHYGLPLQMGGWQDVALETLIDWMETRRMPKRKLLEIH
jgi:hypothetical protein